MIVKPTILIFTARDEKGEIAKLIVDQVNSLGEYNAVKIDESMYVRPNNTKFLEYYDDSKLGEIVRGLTHKKVLDSKSKKLVGRDKRIINAIKRFNPVYVIAVTPLAHEYLVEAKIKGGLNTKLIYYCPDFVQGKEIINKETDLYLFENAYIKEKLIGEGLDKNKAKTLGLPFSLEKLSHEDELNLKQELGLPKNKIVLLNISDFELCKNTLEVLVDQGELFSIVVNCKDSDIEGFAETINRVPGINVKFVEKNLEKYLLVSDILVTEGDVSVLYKAFSIGLPVIGIDNGINENLIYLRDKGAILYSNTWYEVVREIYEIIQTDKKQELIEKGHNIISISSIENIAQFLTNFLEFKD